MVALEKNQQSQPPKVIRLKDYQPTDFSINAVHLHFDLFDDHTLVHSIIDFARNPDATTQSTDLHLHGEELELMRISRDGKDLSESDYTLSDEHLIVHEVADEFKLEIVVKIHPETNKQLSGLYLSSGNFCTQCEPEGFRRITYYYDRPDVLTRFTTTITADKNKYPMLLANGNLMEQRDLENNRHWVKWYDPSQKPCYLFALVAGDFDLLEDTFTTMSGHEVKLHIYVEKGMGARAPFAMQALKHSMQWDEETFGREYDLSVYMIVAVSDFNMGAMENKGLNIFNTKYVLADDKTATDGDFINIERVIGHEYFHNWSGNRITCRDWFQITLKEGLTVLREQLFCADMTSHALVRIQTAQTMRQIQFAQDAGPMSHSIRPEEYIEINNFYTVTVYEKGSEVIRMVRTLISPDVFRQAMDHYFATHDGKAVTTEDFLASMEHASGMDLSQFKRWYQQAGTPIITITTNYDANKQTYTITLQQDIAGSADLSHHPLLIPISVALLDKNGNYLKTTLENNSIEMKEHGTFVLPFNQHQQTFIFESVNEEPLLSLLRDFSAPVKLNYHRSETTLCKLMQYDQDAFARWDAAQTYFSNIIMEAINHTSDQPLLTDACKQALITLLEEPSNYTIKALMLTLPTHAYIAEQMPINEVERIHHVRSKLKYEIATALKEQFLKLFSELEQSQYTFEKEAIAKRGLRNVILSYLVASKDTTSMKTAFESTTAKNMTDRYGALLALNHFDNTLRSKALQQFHNEFINDALVMDKWLVLRASLPSAENIDQIKRILDSDDFDLLNPNKVRALLGAFAANQVCFHQPSGAGYALLADQVIALDPHNRLTAARLCEPLTRFQKMHTSNKAMMKMQLQRILDAPDLSKDTYEVVSKALAHS